MPLYGIARPIIHGKDIIIHYREGTKSLDFILVYRIILPFPSSYIENP